MAARIFLPALPSEAGAAALGELSLSVGGTGHNSMGSVPSCPWSVTDAPGVRQKHGGAPHPAGFRAHNLSVWTRRPLGGWRAVRGGHPSRPCVWAAAAMTWTAGLPACPGQVGVGDERARVLAPPW